MSCSSLSRNVVPGRLHVHILCVALCGTAVVADPAGDEAPRAGDGDVRYIAAPAVPSNATPGAGALDRARELQREVSAWLHDEIGLPELAEAPGIMFVPDDRIADQRFRDVPADRTGADDADVLAVYDDDTRTIYLPMSWSADRSVGGSILVHETVHHIQNLTGEAFACPEAREAAAFEAQERWLKRFGDSLESEFGIDPFTVLARSMCGW